MAEARRSDAEADYVGERIERPTERSGFMAPARDASVQHVEYQRQDEKQNRRYGLRRPDDTAG